MCLSMVMGSSLPCALKPSTREWPLLPRINVCAKTIDHNQEYIIKWEGEYPTTLYPSVTAVSRGHDLYNSIHVCLVSQFTPLPLTNAHTWLSEANMGLQV